MKKREIGTLKFNPCSADQSRFCVGSLYERSHKWEREIGFSEVNRFVNKSVGSPMLQEAGDVWDGERFLVLDRPKTARSFIAREFVVQAFSCTAEDLASGRKQFSNSSSWLLSRQALPHQL